MKHYTVEELDRFRNKDMSVLARIKCSEHLKKCDLCRALLGNLHLDDMFVADLQNALKLMNDQSRQCETTFKKLNRLLK